MELSKERIEEIIGIQHKMRDCQNRDNQLNKIKKALNADSFLIVSFKNKDERFPDDLDLEFRQYCSRRIDEEIQKNIDVFNSLSLNPIKKTDGS